MPPQSSSPRRVSLEWASVWALAATIIIATVLVIPIVATPTVPTKAFALASGVYRPAKDERVGVLVCGGNVDLATIAAA